MRAKIPLQATFLLGLLAIFVARAGAADFERPSASARLAALGDLAGSPEALRPFLGPDRDFAPIPLPSPHDWLAQHEERGQTFAGFIADSYARPDANRRVIYLLPLGKFPAETSPSLSELSAYAAAFFQLEVKVLPGFQPAATQFTPRLHPRTGQRQLLAPDILEFLVERLPADGYCLLGVTMEDLYPEPKWNYVFGLASLTSRTGVHSFARYDPGFLTPGRTPVDRTLQLQRGCKVLAHEVAHMFGLEHCIYYDCVLNGGNHLAETDASPQHACPICLRKLQASIGFDAAKRYRDLAEFYRRCRWTNELNWVNRQLAKVADTTR